MKFKLKKQVPPDATPPTLAPDAHAAFAAVAAMLERPELERAVMIAALEMSLPEKQAVVQLINRAMRALERMKHSRLTLRQLE